jgi:signal peptidase II
VDRAKRRAATLLFVVAGFELLIDRATKSWAHAHLPGRPIDVISGVLSLRYTTNSGGAFSIGQKAPWLFAAASVAVAGLIIVTAFRHSRATTALALGLVLGGSLGNLSDRLLGGQGFGAGRVIDFIDFHVWPIFNLADTAIVTGALLLAFTTRTRRSRATRTIDQDGPAPAIPAARTPDGA